MATHSTHYFNLVNEINPVLKNVEGGKDVLNAQVWYSPVEDRISLLVEHKLISRMEFERDGKKWDRLVGPRVRRAMLCDGPPPGKEIRAQRRQMFFRGTEARKSKPRVK